ncbi:MAG: sirohydrochlorin cobaltochelatase [Oscillospiraceae bacterium]|nr:sirohydrochlorin cobaltochelatase [Oscillospiraceae bacterium]
MKKILALLLVFCLLPTLFVGRAVSASAEEQEKDEENYETGDASLDDPLNQDGIGEKELLVVSFGTSFNDSRRLTVGAIEKALQEAYPDWSVRRAFTSQIIIDHLAKRDGEIIDNVHDALERAIRNGVKILVVQPTHLMDGFEYNDLKKELAAYADAFDRIVLGDALLTIDRDFDMVAEAIVEATAAYDDGETAVCFMGHGTEAASNSVYAKMQTVLSEAGCEHYYIGTVEAEPSVEDVLESVRAGSYKRVVLRPLMIVAGDHANNDMAGDEADSWKSVFEAAGYEVSCVVEGLGQLPAIRQLIVEHAGEAMAK